MYELSAATGPAVFESNNTTVTTDDAAAFATFTPDSALLLSEVENLSTDMTSLLETATVDRSGGRCA